MRACGGVWIAHGSGDADRAMVDARNRVPVPPDEPRYTLRRVWLTEQQERLYYDGLANQGLWPLRHIVFTRPVFQSGGMAGLSQSQRDLRPSLRQTPPSSSSCVSFALPAASAKHQFEKPRFYNEFAEWVSEALQEARLAEQLATIDLLSITSIRDLRDALIAPIEKHIRGTGAQHNCPEGDEFHFCEAKSFIMPTGLVAHDVADFFQKVAGVTNPCLHFHFFEARLRLGRPTNDFSRWLQAAGDSPASGTRSGSKLGLHQG
jgi:hypothetical protein